MELIELHVSTGHERVVEARDDRVGYHGFVAIHDTTLGPAVGGTRLWPYATRDDALADVLRLSEAMTYKAAIAGVPFGGGKSVIVADPRTMDRRAIFLAHARLIDALGGRYMGGEDVGTSPADIVAMREVTRWAVGLSDPSPGTGHGVCQAMRAAAELRWGTTSLEGRTVALQGCGNVGHHVARELRGEGVRLVVSDVDRSRVERMVSELGATAVEPDTIFDVEADIFAPCALGAILNDDTIPRLRAAIVCGAANNQLQQPRHAEALAARGVLYVPDFVANAGGIIHGAQEVCGWSADRSRQAIDDIAVTVREVIARAAAGGVTTAAAALELATARVGSRSSA